MNWAVPVAGTGTKPHSLGGGGELGVYAPKCRSMSRGTPSRWEWRSCETASGMSSLRFAGSCSSGPSDDVRSSGVGPQGGSRAGERRGCAPWQPGGLAGPPSTGRAGGGLQRGDRGGVGVHGGPTTGRGRHCDALAAGYRADTQGCGGGKGTGPSGAGCTAASAWPPLLRLSPRPLRGPLPPPDPACVGASVLVLHGGLCGRGIPCRGRGPMGCRATSWTPLRRSSSLARCDAGSASCPCRSRRA